MKLTILQSVLEGLVDTDHPPMVFDGHLTLEQATEIARQHGIGYPCFACVVCNESEGAVFYANFANEENPPRNTDGTVERPSQGHLELWFYHIEFERAT